MKAKDFVTEKWTEKYKKSINCQHPKGFSQKAHCAGRKKNEDATATMPNTEIPDIAKEPGALKRGAKKLGKVLGKGLGALDFIDAAQKFSKGDVPGGAESTLSGITYAVPIVGLPLGIAKDIAKDAGYDPLDYSSKAYPKGPKGETLYPIVPFEGKSNVLKGLVIAEQSQFDQMLKNITSQNPKGSAAEQILLGKFLGSDQGTYARNILGKNHKGWIEHIASWLKKNKNRLQQEFNELDFSDLESLAYDMYENYLAKQGQLEEGEVVSLKDNPATLKRLAKQWWNGNEQQHAQAQQMLEKMGWDIYEDDDNIVLSKDDQEHILPMDDLQGVMEGEVVSMQARKTPLVVAGSPFDWNIYDLRTNKIVANILGGDRRESKLYEIRINKNGLPDKMLPTYVLTAGPDDNPPYKAYELVDTPERYGKIEKSPGPGGTTKLRPDQDDVLRHFFKVMGGGKYYGYDLALVEEGLDQYQIIEKALGAKIMEVDDAMELDYTDWDPEDSSSIVYLGNKKNKDINEFFDTGGGSDDDDELKRQVIEMYKEDGLRELEISRITGLSEIAVHNIIDAYERGDFEIDEGYSAGAAGGVGLGEEQDFKGFLNKALTNKVEPTPKKYDPNTTMGFHNMPGYKNALDFGLAIIGKMDDKTKKYYANKDEDVLLDYMFKVAKRNNLLVTEFSDPTDEDHADVFRGGKFYEEDLFEVPGLFSEVFHDPNMGSSWLDLLKDNLTEYGEYDTKRIIQFSKDNPPDLNYLYQQFIQRMLNPENVVDPNEWIDKVNKHYGLNYTWKDYQTRGRNDHTNNWQRIVNRYVVGRK